MAFGRFPALLLASISVAFLSGCSASNDGAAQPEPTPVVTTPQAAIDGEWILTRVVTASDDTSTPDRAVGAQSVRYVLVSRESCDTALCPGTVTSGAAVADRESTALNQSDGGFSYDFVGALNCLNTGTGGVLFVDGFEFSQHVELTAAATEDVAGVATATSLTGTASYTDTVTDAAIAGRCVRDPRTITIEYSVTAVRATP